MHPPRIRLTFLPGVVLCWWLVHTPEAAADIIHVGPGQTHATIEAGYAASNNGDTLLIHDATYALASTLNVAKLLTFQAVNIGGARVTGGGAGPDDSIFFLSANSSYIGLFFSSSNSGHALYQRDTGAHGIVQQSIFTGITNPIFINNSGGMSGSFDVKNVTINNADHAVNINDGGTIDIRNSIIANTDTAYVAHNNIAVNPSHNLLFNVSTVSSTTSSGHVNSDAAQLVGDPMFVDAANFDFHLMSGSPAIDTGTDVGLPYFGSAPDRGAFEFSPSSAVPEPGTLSLFAVGVLGLVALGRGRRLGSRANLDLLGKTEKLDPLH